YKLEIDGQVKWLCQIAELCEFFTDVITIRRPAAAQHVLSAEFGGSFKGREKCFDIHVRQDARQLDIQQPQSGSSQGVLRLLQQILIFAERIFRLIGSDGDWTKTDVIISSLGSNLDQIRGAATEKRQVCQREFALHAAADT